MSKRFRVSGLIFLGIWLLGTGCNGILKVRDIQSQNDQVVLVYTQQLNHAGIFGSELNQGLIFCDLAEGEDLKNCRLVPVNYNQ